MFFWQNVVQARLDILPLSSQLYMGFAHDCRIWIQFSTIQEANCEL